MQVALARALLQVRELPLSLGLGRLDSAARNPQLLARHCCPRVHLGLCALRGVGCAGGEEVGYARGWGGRPP